MRSMVLILLAIASCAFALGPLVENIVPTSIPMNGTVVNVYGNNFEEGLLVFIGGVLVENVTWVDVYTFTFNATSQTVPGYYNLTILNPDGQFTFSDYMVYYTNDCPVPGKLGCLGDDSCQDCPLGARCRGGCRVWPLPGYWTAGEGTGKGSALLSGRSLYRLQLGTV
eukprot:EC723152.1.p1 GENE.EC723152.1~~EC723152.1.p1  ORF type:complete len:168 (+),score=21.99 EC723152.1:54-557(+)